MKPILWRRTSLLLGLSFLYIPLFVLIVFSFNKVSLLTVWGGWSFRWYYHLLENNELLSAAWVSIRIGVIASTLSIFLGFLLAIAFVRIKRFTGRLWLFGASITPMMLPDVITGLSLLLFFISIQHMLGIQDIAGFWGIVIAHTTFCTAYSSIVLQTRLRQLDPYIEEAAMDLGAKPQTILWRVIFPQMIGAVIAAWVISFTLSLDDLVITSFVSGAEVTTLPMYIYSTIRNTISPELNALATILITLLSAAIAVGYWILQHQQRKKN